MVSRRTGQEGMLDRFTTWADARREYLACGRGLTGAVSLGIRLLRSGRAGAVLREKLFGTSLTRRLAPGWLKSGAYS